MINASLGFTAKVVHSAIESKSWAGSGAYIVGAAKTLLSSDAESYRIKIHNSLSLVYNQDITSLLVFVMNGKHGGGGMPFCPGAFMNDGMFDTAFCTNVTAKHIPGIYSDVALNGGMHAYDTNWTHVRGDKFVAENLNFLGEREL